MACFIRLFILLSFGVLLSGCGFRMQGEKSLAAPLNRLYLQAPDPYGQLVRSLKEYLKISHVQLVSKEEASTILTITQDDTSQELLSVSGTQQTRQYILRVTVSFEISNPEGLSLLPTQTLTESRTITIQSNQILGSSNETNLFYQQMRRTLAYSIINRLASREVARAINTPPSS